MERHGIVWPALVPVWRRLAGMVWVVLALAGCATTAEDRIQSAVQRLDQSRLLDRLETLSDAAEDLNTIRELFRNLDDVATVCKGLRSALDSETVDWILSKVGVVKLGWELLDTLEVMKQFWRSVDELRAAPRALRKAVQNARRNPCDQTMAELAASCASTRSTLGKTGRFLGMLKAWVGSADLAVRLAKDQLDTLEAEYDSWGASLVIGGIKELVDMYAPDFIQSAKTSIASVETQFLEDAKLLEQVELLLRPAK